MKEQIYEHENKNSELELQQESERNDLNDRIAQLQKDLQKSKDTEVDLGRRYEQLKKRYDSECEQLKTSQETEKSLNTQRMNELETQLKETQDTFEMAKQSWAKDEAVLKQKMEFVQY